MLSRKNKDLRTIKEGVVGRYVKKDTPPEMPSKLKTRLEQFITIISFKLSMFGQQNLKEEYRVREGHLCPQI